MKQYNDGMAKPMNDKDYWWLMTTNSKGQRDDKMVATTLKYYPHLAQFNV